MANKYEFPLRCGIVLAGGEGQRLQRFVLQLKGQKLPKQYVNFIGTRSMLEHTFHRAEKLIPPTRLFTVVSQDHLRLSEAKRQLLKRPAHTLVSQPMNRETGPGILLPLLHVHKHYPESVVAVFPSDHFILEEDIFMEHVEMAFRWVDQDPTRMVLLGVEPSDWDREYGYILPEAESCHDTSPGVLGVRNFIEKPETRDLPELASQGALWNTMVMVFKAKTLLALLRLVTPRFYRSFQEIWQTIGTSREGSVVENTYRCMAPLNFSKDIMEAIALHYRSCLSLVPVKGVLWSDWGSDSRILRLLQNIGCLNRLNQVSEGHPSENLGIPTVDQREIGAFL